jgi:ferritin-like metal-binding protein YciE
MNLPESYPDYFGDDAANSRGFPPTLEETNPLPGLAEARQETSPEGSFEQHWLHTLAHVLTEEIQELHSAEKMLDAALPAMTEACADPILRAVAEINRDLAHTQAQRLEAVQQMLGRVCDGRTNLAMEGLLVGLHEMIEENRPGQSRDACLVGVARRIKHHEIAAYCSARDFAQLLGLAPVAELLQKTLDEETTLEAKFTNLEQLMIARVWRAGTNGPFL